MNPEFSWKKFQFITEVQTALIANAINISLEPNAKERRHIFSATGTLISMDDAFYAAERIPDKLTAHEAACEFIKFSCENLRPKFRTKIGLWTKCRCADFRAKKWGLTIFSIPKWVNRHVGNAYGVIL